MTTNVRPMVIAVLAGLGGCTLGSAPPRERVAGADHDATCALHETGALTLPDDVAAGELSPGGDRLSATPCAGSAFGSFAEGGGEAIYSFEIEEPTNVTISGGGGPFKLALRTTCTDDATDLACSDPYLRPRVRATLEEGLYYVVLKGERFAEPAYSIQLESSPVAANGLCRNASPLEDGAALQDIDASDGGAVRTACSSGDGRRLYYAVEVPAGQELVASARPSAFSAGSPRLKLLDGCDPDRACAGFGVEEDGTSVLRFQNHGDEARSFVLELADVPEGMHADLSVDLVDLAYTVEREPVDCDDMSGASVLRRAALQVGGGVGHWELPEDPETHVLPFAFPFFGAEMTHYWPARSGFAQLFPFEATHAEDLTRSGFGPDGANGLVAPFWTYDGGFWDWLEPVGDPEPSDIRVATFGDAPERHFTIQWTRWSIHTGTVLEQGSEPVTFQAQLYEGSGVVEYHYCALPGEALDPVVTGSRSSIGLENGDGSVVVSVGDDQVGTASSSEAIRLVPAL